MTIKEFYEWAKENKIENYKIFVTYEEEIAPLEKHEIMIDDYNFEITL